MMVLNFSKNFKFSREFFFFAHLLQATSNNVTALNLRLCKTLRISSKKFTNALDEIFFAGAKFKEKIFEKFN